MPSQKRRESYPPNSRVVDVSDSSNVDDLIAFTRRETGRVDVLFNNAGYGSHGRIEDHPHGAFEKLVAVHVFGALYGMRAAIPLMREQGYGRIINTLSRAAELPGPMGAAYAAAKAALWSLTRSAAWLDALSRIYVPMPPDGT